MWHLSHLSIDQVRTSTLTFTFCNLSEQLKNSSQISGAVDDLVSCVTLGGPIREDLYWVCLAQARQASLTLFAFFRMVLTKNAQSAVPSKSAAGPADAVLTSQSLSSPTAASD